MTIATGEDALASDVNALITAGLLLNWGGAIADIPTGWLLCNGSAISRATYSALFTAIGTIHGVGDGSTTFNLPDLRDVFVIGAKEDDTGVPKTNVTGALTQTGGAATHTLITNEMPAHTHTCTQITTGSIGFPGGGAGFPTTNTGSTGGGAAHNNLPPYYALAYIIKT